MASKSLFAAACTRLLLALLTITCLGAGEASGAQLTASWVDNSNGAATTRLERRSGTNPVFVAVADVQPGVSAYVDAAVGPGVTYCYRALAYDAAGVSPYSAESCATTSGAPALNVTVNKAGRGAGAVASTPAGILCGPTCSGSFQAGASVTLTATPATGSRFTGWIGGCVGTGACVVSGNEPVTVTATFAPVSDTFVDFDGDGKADILWRHSSGALALWLMDGTSIANGMVFGSVDTDWTIVGVGDFNGDGAPDILWRHASGAIAVWLLDGSTVIATGVIGSAVSEWTVAGVGDFNGDGKTDILWHHTSGTITVWLLDGLMVTGSGSPGAGLAGWNVAGVGDVDGDGKADVLWRHASGTVAVWLLDGPNMIGASIIRDVTNEWTVAQVGDFNGDGRVDILWRHVSGTVAVWLLDGATVIGSGVLGDTSVEWTVAQIGDFNGDGSDDILWRNTSGTIAVWLLNGTSVIGSGAPGGAASAWQIQ
ncbi:MAG: FG-GAP-like repeat-containing protein [Gammaproteobacteria bacterium]